MIITVDAGGYRTAAAAFAGANEVAALQHAALLARLDGCSAMAGSDSTSLAFSSAYDAAAAEALHSLGDLVAAFATLGRLADLSLHHHARAEYDATLFHTAPDDPVAASYVTVAPASLPSSFGGTPASLTSMQRWVLQHVEGFVWPDADTARLRAAASAWRTAAESLHVLADHCTTAADALSSQRSPEIPTAVSAALSLRRTVFDLAASFGALASHCDSYAAEVDAKHAELLAVLDEIVRIAAEQLAISAVLGAVSFGLGAAAGLGVLVARIALEAPRLVRIVAALRALADGCAAAVRATHDALSLRRLELARYLRVPVRDERGAARILNGVRPTPTVEATKLGNIVNDLFKGTTNPSRVGDGTTMDAVRAERATGASVHGKMHTTKALNSLRGLENWLRRNPEGAAGDREIATALAKELREALRR